jgi:hypothetical protein
MAISKKTWAPLKGGPEHDALTRFRKFITWRPGQRKAAKVSFNRRVRRQPVETDEPD